jgi:iron-sulfur cluster repair protein YtfE (RIC family)
MRYLMEHRKVRDLVENIDGARDVLRDNNIDGSAQGMSLANAAALTSNTPDELLAKMAYRMRRNAAKRAAETVTEDEAELVA